MALIDILPKFRYKPLELTPVESKLVPRPGESQSAPSPTESPPAAIVRSAKIIPLTGTIPMPTVTQGVDNQILAQNVPRQRLVLPDIYKGLTPLAEAISDSTIVNPKARAAIIAQMGLETGWKSTSDFNYGNITSGKSWTGPEIVRADKDARGNPITQRFRQYSSSKEFLDDYLSLLKNVYPKAYAELHSDNFDIDRFTSGLVDQSKKYAEAPNYKQTIKDIYNSVDSRINRNK
jgi:hypothetical protein